MFWKTWNPQICQSIAIGSILLFGIGFQFIDTTYYISIATIALAVGLDLLIKKQINKKWVFPFSAINTAIGILLFLRTEIWAIYGFTVLLAIASKYLVQVKKKHILNPSYSAIFITLLLFPQITYTNPLQWKGNLLIVAGIALLGTFVHARVKLWDSVIAFFTTFIIGLFVFTDAHIGDAHILVFTGSFFIAMFFGFTEPATIPHKQKDRICFMMQIALLFFVYRLFINENYSFFASYFTVNILHGIYKSIPPIKQKKFMPIVTGIVFCILTSLTLTHINDTGHRPEILSKRCNQIICDA